MFYSGLSSLSRQHIKAYRDKDCPYNMFGWLQFNLKTAACTLRQEVSFTSLSFQTKVMLSLL